MTGYCGNEKATREIIDKEGWLHSGDMAYYDEDGDFFITGRLKEVIKYDGYQVGNNKETTSAKMQLVFE